MPGGSAPDEPPAGTFDVDGHAMFIECKGDGEPTVVLDSGLGVDSTSTWAVVRPAVARFTRVCLYDCAGMAASEPGPGPRTSEAMTAELHALLGGAGVEPPYVLAGASLGGMNAQLFASEHPGEVDGVVLVDSLHPPLIALEHGISFDPGGEPVPSIEKLWGELQADSARLSPGGRVVVAEKSHHRIAEDEPDVVVAAVREVVEQARGG